MDDAMAELGSRMTELAGRAGARVVLALCSVAMLGAPAAAQDDVALGHDDPLPALTEAAMEWRAPSDPVCDTARQTLAQVAGARSRAHAVRLPAIVGEPTQARLTRWAERELVPFLERSLRDLDELDRALRPVLATGCYIESIEALAAHGLAYEALFRALQEMPWPSDIDPELASIYQSQIDPVGAPLRDIAERSYESGLWLARAQRAYGAASQACADGLVRLGAMPAADELVPSRAWISALSALPVPRAIAIGGAPGPA